jgi:hypothetical protein
MSAARLADTDPPLCPSAPCDPGAKLIGIVGPEATVGYLQPPLTVDEHFVESASKDGRAEQRFRFASPCITDGCQYWDGERCGVADGALELRSTTAKPARLPRCGIRPRCRWFAQNGRAACEVCPLVVTDPSPRC